MKLYLNNDNTTILHGDCRELSAVLPENSIDAILTDPPYELGFMGKSWDAAGVAFDPDTWRVFLRDDKVILREYGNDSGGASRFFYVAKPSRSERDAGCEHLPAQSGGEATGRVDGSAGVDNPRAGAGRTGGARNFHPTVKPVTLLRYLVRLITPLGGIVLDPFLGSGTTAVAARLEGYDVVGCELTDEYLPIIAARVTRAERDRTTALSGEACGT